MLKEQLLDFAMKALTQAYETKERIKNNLKSDAVQSYVRSIKEAAVWVVENQWQKLARSEQVGEKAALGRKKSRINTSERVRNNKGASSKNASLAVKKERKSSIKPAKEIGSARADIILQMLKSDSSRIVKKTDALDGKKSLAYLVWALGHAERANVAEGISVHDVSALLYQACKIELYPINISRVVYGNTALVRQVGQEKRTKTYLLTTQGQAMFKEKFL